MNRVEDKATLQYPAICFICEMNNAVDFVDTNFNHDPESFASLRGRKYICETCCSEAAKGFGLFDKKDAEIAELVNKLDLAGDELSEAQEESIRVVPVSEVIDAIRDEIKKVRASQVTGRVKPTKAQVKQAEGDGD